MNRAGMQLLRWTRPHAGRITLAALLGAATVGSSIGLMATSAYLLSAAALHPSIAELGLAIVGVRAFGLARGVFRYLERLATHTLNLKLLSDLRGWFYRTIEPLAPARLMDARSGDLLARAVGDINSLQEFYARVLSPPAVALAVAAMTAAFLGTQDGPLAILFLGFFVTATVLLPASVWKAGRTPARELSAARAALTAEIVETLQGLPDLVAFGAQGSFVQRFRNENDAVAGSHRRWARLQATSAAACSGLGYLATAAVLAWGVHLTAGGRIGGGVLGALALATLAAFEAAAPLPAAAHACETALAAAGRVFALAGVRPEVEEPASPVRPPDSSRGVTLAVRGLRFTYPGESGPALDGIDLRLAPGGRVAIVGPSGAGKSTLASLLLRLWEYSVGEIAIAGQELHTLGTEATRGLFAALPQRPALFNTTLRENLLLADPKASDDELLRVLHRMQLTGFLDSLPAGLDTRIGEGGLALSAGERQRLVLARTLLQAAPILLLDEPTAHLDTLTEQGVLAGLLAVTPPRSLLLITHRMVSLEALDEILVMVRGRVVERGTHARLSQSGGMYQRMRRIQNRAWDVLREPDTQSGGPT